MSNKFDPRKPVQTRNGRPTRIVAVLDEPLADGKTIIAVLDGDVLTLNADGSLRSGRKSPCDLINIPEEVSVERWLVLERKTGAATSYVHDSMDSAVQYVRNAMLNTDEWVVVRLTGGYTR